MQDLVRRPPAMTTWWRPPAETPSLSPVHHMMLAVKAAAIFRIMVVKQSRGELVARERIAAATATTDGDLADIALQGNIGGAGVVGGAGNARSDASAAGNDVFAAVAGKVSSTGARQADGACRGGARNSA